MDLTPPPTEAGVRAAPADRLLLGPDRPAASLP